MFTPYHQITFASAEGGSYTYTASGAYNGSGTVSSGQIVETQPGQATDGTAGTTYTLTATPAEGWSFAAWQVQDADGNWVDADWSASGSFTPDSDMSVRARFVQNTITTTFVYQTSGTFTVDGTEITANTDRSNDKEHQYTLTAVPADGYYLTGWHVDGTDIPIEPTRTEASTVTKVSVSGQVYPIFTPAISVNFEAPPEGLSYTVEASLNGYTVLASHTVTSGGGSYIASVPQGSSFTLKANGSDTKTFSQWTKNGSSLSMDAVYTGVLADSDTVAVLGIALTGDGAYQVGSTKYQTWEQAMYAAVSGDSKNVILLANVTLPTTLADNGLPSSGGTYVTQGSGGVEYSLPAGVRLIIPYSVSGLTEPNPDNHDYPYSLFSPSTDIKTALAMSESYEYRKLTVPEGVTVNVAGTLATGGTISSNPGIAGGTNGSATDTYSVAEVNGTLNVLTGGMVTTCGYIYGSGTLNAQSGAKLYQPMVICDFRAGGYTVSSAGKSFAMGTQSGENYVSPFTRYTTQNIQTTVHMDEGALMYGYCDLYAGSQHNRTTACLIGSSTVAGLIQLKSGASLTAIYDGDDVVSTYAKVGHIDITIEGGAGFGYLTLEVSLSDYISESIATNDLTFPIPYNYSIHLNGTGSTYSIPYSMALLPGATLEVGEGATLDVGSSSSSFRFMVFDGAYDHTHTGSETTNPVTVTYGTQPSLNYPTTAALQAAGKSGTADLIINGTLNINSGVNFGGVVQAGSNNAKLVMASSATPSCKVQMGLVGEGGIDLWIYQKIYYFAGATVRELPAQIVDRGTGQRINIVSGMTYYGAAGSDIISDYTFDLYTTSASTSTKETHTETLNATIEGSWYNYTATIHMVDPTTHAILSTATAYFAHGADVSDYYTDQSCSTRATTVTADNMVLYSDNIEARVEWASGTSATYYPSLRNAVKDAVHTGDKVVLMKDITLDTSIPVDSAQNITITLKDGSAAHSIAYTNTPFINSGKLTLDLGGGTIINLSGGTYTEAPAITNNAEGNLTLRTNGGTISTIYSSKTNVTYASAVTNYGTLTVDGIGGGSIICKNLETVIFYFATTTDDAKANTHGSSYTSTINNTTDYLCGIYNTGTIEDITGTAEIFGACYGIYNGNGTASTTARIESISGGVIRSDHIALNNYYASVGTISGGEFGVTDLAFAFSATTNTTWRNDTVYNFRGSIDSITGGTFTTYDTFRRGSTLTLYYYKSSSSCYTHYYVPGYALYNYGGQINTIDGATITGHYGINNRNYRATAYSSASGSTIGELGVIGVITNVTIDVNRYGIYNGGIINEISGASTITATPDSAQDDTPDSAIDGNVQGYAIYNSNGWYYDTALKTRTDDTTSGVLVRTDVYDTVNKPTIGKITGDVTVTAINTGNSVEHGLALYNAGLINEISGNAKFETSVHPSNTGRTYSRYAIQNTSGGIIETISGNVTLSAGDRTLLNNSYITAQSVTTYTTTSATTTQHVETTYVPSRIGNITGDLNGGGVTIEATFNQYGILNYSEIGDITGKVTITANNATYAISNQGDGAYSSYIFDWPNAGSGTVKNYTYTRIASTIGTIGGGDSQIVISSKSGYSLMNAGTIDAILDGVTIKATTGSTSTSNNYAALLNNEGLQKEYSYTVTNLGTNAEDSSRYDTKYERTYTYEETGGYIGTIEGNVKITTGGYYALSNLGTIDRIGTGVQITSGKADALYNTGHYVGTRHTIQYYYGTSAFATTTSYFGEQPLDYTRSPASIGVIDGVSITASSVSTSDASCYAINNGGNIGTIVNSTIQAQTGSRAISNTATTTTSYVNNMGDAFITYDPSTIKYAVAAVTNSIYQYTPGVIGLIGGGNTITGTTNVIINSGTITAIDNTDGRGNTLENSTVTASTGVALYNYRRVTFQTTKVNGESTSTYADASIGTVKNLQITAATYAIQNGSGESGYGTQTITELSEGVEATSTGSYAVYNQTYASIGSITGGIYTASASGKYAVYNNNTSAAIPISGGDFKGGTDTDTTKGRAYAIYQPDTTTRQTYPEGYTLSGVGVTRDTSVGSGYYYITPNQFTIHFNGSDGSGSIADVVVTPANGTVTLPTNTFTSPNGGSMTFKGWAATKGKADPDIETEDGTWTGTAEQFKTALGLSALGAGSEITLYAVWQAEDAISVTISWGAMSYSYEAPAYRWDPDKLQYVQTNPTTAGWKAVGDTSADGLAPGEIRITNDADSTVPVTATVSFGAQNDLGWTPSLLLNGSKNTLTLSSIAPSSSQTVTAMLEGVPTSTGSGVTVGTVTITLAKS